jgi:3-oxoacyl-[acyl-carrier protein] reductase
MTETMDPPGDASAHSLRRRALVTGGSGGIGAAICAVLAARGAHVIVHARTSAERAELVAAAIRSRGGTAEIALFDVTDAEATRAGLDGLLAGGPIDIVVNNAGVTADGPFPALSPEQWRRPLRVALDGFFNVTQPLVMPMVQRRWGRVVTLSSVAALLGNRGQTNYAAAKAGVIGATRSLARELARKGVTVNAVAPGFIETEMLPSTPLEELLAHVPMRRLGQPEEVANLVGWLCSDEASYVTGQVIAVDGGVS